MDFVVEDSEWARQLDSAPSRTFCRTTLGRRLSGVLASAWRHIPTAYQTALEAHWNANGGLYVAIQPLPNQWNACADVKSGRGLFFTPHAVTLPDHVLVHVCGEELLHLWQSLSGKFTRSGQYEEDVDALMVQCGFNPRALWDFYASMTSTRIIPFGEWKSLQRQRYAK